VVNGRTPRRSLTRSPNFPLMRYSAGGTATSVSKFAPSKRVRAMGERYAPRIWRSAKRTACVSSD
jgi:hypothetical protein